MRRPRSSTTCSARSSPRRSKPRGITSQPGGLDLRRRAGSFGSAAGRYDRYRLDYPDDVVDRILHYAGATIRTAVEIGAGTGKATRVVAARGIEVIATDPDPTMLAELRRRSPGVATVAEPLERLPRLAPVDLVYAAASLHWTRPEGRWRRIADLLGPGAVVAVFAAEIELERAEDREATEEVWARHGGRPDLPPSDDTSPNDEMPWPGQELMRSGLFDDVRFSRIERRMSLPAEHYVGLLSTVSAALVLPPEERTDLLEHLRKVLPDAVVVRADVPLHLARRTASAEAPTVS